MLFRTTDEHEALRKKVRAFAEEKVKPIAFDLDQKNEFPDDIVKEMGELGFMGIPYPKEYGGQGLDAISYAITVEELSRVDGGVGVICSAHTSLGSWPIFAYGTEEQKKKYLTPLASGKKLGGFGLTEENAGSDAGGTETTAELDGDHYILNGKKIFITNAPKADTYVVFAVTTPGIGTHGISAFIVEKEFEGFTFSDHYDKLGIRSSSTAELHFDNVKVPKENLLGKEGQGFKIAMETLDGGRIGIASQALGIGQGAYESALAYAKEREQFGMPIAHLQRNTFKLADMATYLHGARLMIYHAADLKTHHERYSAEAAMAKQVASDLAMQITTEAIQLYGGSGFIKGVDVERFFRDAKITQIYEGTNEIMRVVVGANTVGRPPRVKTVGGKSKQGPIAGVRKGEIFEGDPKEAVKNLVAALKKDGYDFTVGIDPWTPVTEAERIVVAGRGIGDKENMKLIEELAYQAGAAISSSRPVAETLKYVPLDRYVGMSGQNFKNNLYIGVGVSGAGQHLKGIRDASTIVAINNSKNAPIFANADYGIVGDFKEVLPLLIKELDNGEEKKPAPPMKKVKRSKPRKMAPKEDLYVDLGSGYEYDPEIGDPTQGVEPGTPFDKLPDSWVSPVSGEAKEEFIKVEFPEDRK
ncbi:MULTISPECIES: acyl-CoA dehydrogenase family protein [Anaerococcus]|uniref:Acyl-CoA dehydrogenase n=5 Tax=Anaerococcus TaxID=165779 RepID=A0A2I1M9C0_9FIRM|nr:MULTISPECIES: acyl-CoA dehydrogenase family protein [Anaerococcus]MBS6106526.1 acyl-CoA dehydrogenase family protein [Anaerococcus sp.]MDU4026244.1 acyl-CoA dehydrogenase family protein [Anaerococcus sp.]PKZ16699.1 acyl-CoA dehydrogenase [Anaerococcus octavius]